MSDEDINRAIAEYCGKRWHQPTPQEFASSSYYQYAPNYCADLNAMHEAENMAIFPAAKGMVYGRELQHVCSEEGPIQCGQTQWERWSFSATARQRAEAFLRAIGKWQEVAGLEPAK